MKNLIKFKSPLWDIVLFCAGLAIMYNLDKIYRYASGGGYLDRTVGLIYYFILLPMAIYAFMLIRADKEEDVLPKLFKLGFSIAGPAGVSMFTAVSYSAFHPEHFSCGFGACSWNPPTTGVTGFCINLTLTLLLCVLPIVAALFMAMFGRIVQSHRNTMASLKRV